MYTPELDHVGKYATIFYDNYKPIYSREIDVRPITLASCGYMSQYFEKIGDVQK